ncbi:MAG: hypothetical protein L3K19_03385 [Thermoplasmata archaeon]|nr:hypothetical protein [Thermoplasmata archaeon]
MRRVNPNPANPLRGDGPGQTPILTIDDFVLGERARFDSVEYIVARMVFLVFILIGAAVVVVELLRLAAPG